MVTMAIGAETAQKATPGRLAAWSGIVGSLLVGAAVVLVFALSPSATGGDAVQTISDFFAEGGGSNTLVAAEPLSVLGGFLFLWFLGRLASRLREAEGGSGRHSIPVLAGGIAFVVLAFASVTASTTVSGLLVFSEAFQADPHTAMLFSHLGYVLLTGSMIGAAVLLAGGGALIRRTSTLPRWLGTMAYVLFPISVISLFFVYLPVILFLIWALLVSVSMLRTD